MGLCWDSCLDWCACAFVWRYAVGTLTHFTLGRVVACAGCPTFAQALYKSSFKHFNAIQTQVFDSLYDNDDNVLVAAPPGSGKTVCAELALLRLFSQNPDGTAVYIAPLEAIANVRLRPVMALRCGRLLVAGFLGLCSFTGTSLICGFVLCDPPVSFYSLQEMYDYWNKKFGEGLDKAVVKLTGETQADLKLVSQAHIVVTTPQKWDLLSRRWRQRKTVQAVSLYIVDELHLIGGEAGPTLEVSPTGQPERVWIAGPRSLYLLVLLVLHPFWRLYTVLGAPSH